jgi:hypothetical protein
MAKPITVSGKLSKMFDRITVPMGNQEMLALRCRNCGWMYVTEENEAADHECVQRTKQSNRDRLRALIKY